jgi:hypothetical protein
MKATWLLLLASACAAISPVFSRDQQRVGTETVPRWPSHFQGRTLQELRMDEHERTSLAGFPGAVARFTDGERDIVMRWVMQPTRRLHPAEDCYRGLGFETSQSRIVSDSDRTHWRCFTASRGDGERRQVCEQLQDREGRRWTDVSAWYWSATLRRSEGPWLVTTVAE